MREAKNVKTGVMEYCKLATCERVSEVMPPAYLALFDHCPILMGLINKYID